MTKIEFLSTLRGALVGRVSEQTVRDTVAYYDSFIDERSAGGYEAEVLEALGDPRLIARSIVDAENGQSDRAQSENTYPDPERETQIANVVSKVPPVVWAGLALAGLITVAVIAMKVLFAFGPVIAIIVIIALLYKKFKR